MHEFISAGGMQSYTVTKYLSRRSAPTIEDEYQWFEQTRTESSSYVWGIYVHAEGKRCLIGNTAINSIAYHPMSGASTGFMIFRPEYWGNGIASACHKARTWYAFTQLGLTRISSGVYEPNIGSRKALEKVGYIPTHTERNAGFVDGRYISLTHFIIINPLHTHWTAWWHGDPIPSEFLDARIRTQTALEWVNTHVQFS
ncbi:GNAT family N-acetyltransferase [Candidatus Saccharibacteria bacterium]|nr:GNAT family N-acetyltransferase [Candidatus Saccharibacteria bacterium]